MGVTLDLLHACYKGVLHTFYRKLHHDIQRNDKCPVRSHHQQALLLQKPEDVLLHFGSVLDQRDYLQIYVQNSKTSKFPPQLQARRRASRRRCRRCRTPSTRWGTCSSCPCGSSTAAWRRTPATSCCPSAGPPAPTPSIPGRTTAAALSSPYPTTLGPGCV